MLDLTKDEEKLVLVWRGIKTHGFGELRATVSDKVPQMIYKNLSEKF